jgi:hypothetical protein
MRTIVVRNVIESEHHIAHDAVAIANKQMRQRGTKIAQDGSWRIVIGAERHGKQSHAFSNRRYAYRQWHSSTGLLVCGERQVFVNVFVK